jgi:hypothetical protein
MISKARYLIVCAIIFGIFTLGEIPAYSQSVYSVACGAISSLPYHGDGQFSESSNCAAPFDDVHGSYIAQELNGEQFSPPGDDGNGGYIDVTQAGVVSVTWKVEVDFRDSQAQSDRYNNQKSKCDQYSGDPNHKTDSPVSSTSCIGSEGYGVSDDASGVSTAYVVTDCVEINVEVIVRAGTPAPFQRKRDVMEKSIDFATQALQILMGAASSACSQFTMPPSGGNPPPPPSGGTPPSTSSQPELVVETPQGTQTWPADQDKTTTLTSSGTVKVGIRCDDILVFFLVAQVVFEDEPGSLRGYGALFATYCAKLRAEGRLTSASIDPAVSAQSSHSVVEFQINGGRADITLEDPTAPIVVKTPNAEISLISSNAFSVKHNPSTGASTVTSNQGTVSVKGNSSSSSKNVSSGQEVQVTNSGVGQPGPIGSTSPPSSNQPPTSVAPPAGNGSDLASYDADKSCTIEDSEFFNIVDAWISQIMDNTLFFTAVDVWIGQTSVCAASTSTIKNSQLNSFSLSQDSRGTTTFSTSRQNVNSIGLEVFDLTGRQISFNTASGHHLTWNQRTAHGERVPNGIYLYRVSAHDTEGIILHSNIKKLVVLN